MFSGEFRRKISLIRFNSLNIKSEIWRRAVAIVLFKKVLLKLLQNSQESTSARASFSIKLLAARTTLLIKRLWHWCFPVNFVKFLKALFIQSTSGRLLLQFLRDIRVGLLVDRTSILFCVI